VFRDPRMEELIRLLGDDPVAQRIIASANGPKSYERVRRQLEARALELGLDIQQPCDFHHPPPGVVDAPLRLGRTARGHFCGLSPQDPVTIYGRSGAGKTNVILVFLLAAWLTFRTSIRWINFDRKGDYRFLSQSIDDLVVVRAGHDLRWNPMRPPPGVSLRKHTHRHVGLLVQAFDFGEAARGLLIQAHHELYERNGCYEGSGKWPTPHDLVEWLKWKADVNSKDRNIQEYVSRILNKLVPLLYVLGDVFACRDDFIDQLVARRVVLETDALEGGALTYVVTGLMQWCMSYRMDNNLRGPVDLLLIFDEAKRYYDRQRERNAKEISYLAEVTSQIREFGVGIVASDQQPSAVASSIQANAAVTLCFSLVHGKDIWDVSQSMRFERRQANALPGLPVGTAVCRKSMGFVEPFLLSVFPAPVKKDGEANEEVERLNEPRLKALTYTQATTPRPWEISRDRKEMAADFTDDGIAIGCGALPDLHLEFLRQIHDNPLMSLTEHYQALKLSGSQTTKLKRELFDKRHLVATIRIRKVFPFLTEAGYRAVGAKRRGKGDVLHVHLQHMVLMHLASQGVSGEIEKHLNGKAVDVLAMADGKLLAFEIELRASDQAMENIRKDLAAGADEVTVLSPFGSVLSAIQRAAARIETQLLSRVRFLEMKEFLGTT